jgi:predicted  nucleic acid-binding Zn-ribbon protein
MKRFLRLFPFVQGIEIDLKESKAETERLESLIASQNRYIDALETWKNYNQPKIRDLEMQNKALRDENARLKNRLAGGS